RRAMLASTRHFLFAMLALALAGCGNDQKPLPAAPKPVENWQTQTLAVAGGPSKPVKEGIAPFSYIVETPCMIRVVDQTTNQNLLTYPLVTGKTIVTVDPTRGVLIGGATMKAGPLPEDHRYAVFLESNTRENIIQRGTVRPGNPDQPPVIT